MASPETKAEETQHRKSQNAIFIAQICLRILSIATTLAATLVMITSKKSTLVFGIPMDARYSYCSAFEFSAYADTIACAFCVLSLFYYTIIYLRRHPGKSTCRYNFLLLHDLLMMSLVLAGSAAAIAIGLLGKQGNSHAGWTAMCDDFGTFCNQVMISIALSFFSFLLLMALTLISANL